MYARSTTRDEENRQHTSTVDDDIPEGSPEPPPPVHTPDKPTERQDEPLSIELKGERSGHSSCTAGLTSTEADMLTMSESVNGPRNMLKKLSNTSEHERKHSERSC